MKLRLPGCAVEVVDEIDSTNSELMRRARAGRTGRVLLVAREQTAGRGRLGRGWVSRAGESLTFSLGLKLAPADWSGLSLAVGVSLAESLHPQVGLKWPNDLWVADRKLGGILVETASFGEGAAAGRYAVVGVGINIAPRPETGLSTPPAALQDLDPAVTADTALQRLGAPLLAALEAFEAYGFTPFQARFNARDVLRDREVQLSDGTAGTAHGVSEAGALLVHTAAGMRTVTSSEVSVRPRP
ncbi:biotin--[acetyl-CoA-carboxylase] ligase [Ramlibacter albus]|uniref:biotin--[biotin carboxyl-carrier protein] ligase n=1 Tax=Ramlibacter albus TaxID=2079448 RepID=A0A923M490_9BURK|nr:biotin--[acetyl-CoA-carboxylase] ligase [Ramlibacter albus]MBC5763665.1 biotin--[acetyl-CoA-carboxylase] ligase [Ramlibacter albus]